MSGMPYERDGHFKMMGPRSMQLHGHSTLQQAAYGTDKDDEMEDDEEDTPEERKQALKTCLFHLFYFVLGCLVTLLITYFVMHFKAGQGNHADASWNSSDYEDGFSFYANVPQHPITIQDNMRLSRLSSPRLASSQTVAVFLRTQFDQFGLNRSATTIWFYFLPYTDGYSALPLTRPIWGVHDSQPTFDAYSRTVFFLSNRAGGSDTDVSPITQIFQVAVPFPTSIPSIPLIEPITFMGGLPSRIWNAFRGGAAQTEELGASPAKKAAFHERLRADVPRSSLRDSSGSSSLPTASQSTYIAPIQLTSFPLSVDNLMVGFIPRPPPPAPSINVFAFSVRVFPNMSLAETALHLQALAASGGNSHSYDKLFVRHWDQWADGTRSHIHLMPVSQNADSSINSIEAPIDIMFGVDSDAPTSPDGSPETEWSFSPSALNFAFVRQTYDPVSNVTWTDNKDIYTVAMPQTFPPAPASEFTVTLPPVCRTCDNLAVDTMPLYSTVDDDLFVYLSSTTPGYESDRMHIKVYWNATWIADLTPDWSLSVDSLAWTSLGEGLYVTLSAEARQRVILFDIKSLGNHSVILTEGSNADVQVSGDDSFVLYSSSSYQNPTSINVLYYNASIYNVSVGDLTEGFNAVPLASMQRSPTEEFRFPGALNASIQTWFFQPVGGFVAGKTYPLVFLIHGGPQQAWSDSWSYRWNPQIWTAKGYAVAMVNFHGSNSFGQAFTDSITGNYGSLPYEDLMRALDFFLDTTIGSTFPYQQFLDPNRLAAAGASYGGYMINWIAGHNSAQKYKFRALVCHDGMFDMRAFYYSTDELWFPEHDTQGVPWAQPENYEKWNPAAPQLVSKWNTPMMIIHGGHDYRIDISQGLGAFTALQRQGVPSKFLYFPTEAHQVFNSINQIEWHNEVLEWVGKWTASAAPAAPVRDAPAEHQTL